MSSRQIRRAERELAEKQLQEKLKQEQDDEEDSEEEIVSKPAAKPNLFAMLGNDDGNDEDEEDDPDENPDEEAKVEIEGTQSKEPSSKSSKRSKKKKGKKKAKTKPANIQDTSVSSKMASDLDEIDRALLALKVTSGDQITTASNQDNPATNGELQQLYSVLSVDTQHLHAANEMKKLFGRAALQSDEQPRARQRGPTSDKRSLASLGLRRNIFIQGKEEWPRATSGGLGMEIVEKRVDGSVEYRFAHNSMYQEIQREFQICVRSMDPDRMVALLRSNRKSILYSAQITY